MKVFKPMACLVAIAVAVAVSGCAHPLKVKNINLYKPEFINSQMVSGSLGITPVTSTPFEERLVTSVANNLKRDGFQVAYPYYPQSSTHAVDYTVKMITSSEFKGSGMNFWINFPGFLFWAPAWHGYNYSALLGFDVDITNISTGESLPRLSVPIDLEIRHADINRTWTEISWFEFGIIAFVGGLVFMKYDDSVTPMLADTYETRLAEYVSSKVSSAIIAVN